jgi:Fe-S-cluster-containing hydrogenase component 2
VELRAIHEKCSGCGTCRLACALENLEEVNPAKAALAIKGRFPAPGDYRIQVCDQCGVCAEVCPDEAIHKKGDCYLVDLDACTGCQTCVEACPHEVMFWHKSMETPIKCTLCGACVEVCPREALVIINQKHSEVA